MALLVEKEMSLFGGIAIPQIYIRIEYSVRVDGKTVIANMINYPSREAYLADPVNNRIHIPELKMSRGYSYDRPVDGSDVLTYIHQEYKDFLSTDVYGEIALVDPSTGELQFDPSTGELLTETAVTAPKFAMDSSISIVDIEDVSVG
jgi:hypothetical protein